MCAKRRDCRKLIQISNSNDRIINTAAIDGTKRHSVFWPIYNHEVLGDDDIQLPGKIWISHQGYAMMRQPGIDVAVHRHIMGLKAGEWQASRSYQQRQTGQQKVQLAGGETTAKPCEQVKEEEHCY